MSCAMMFIIENCDILTVVLFVIFFNIMILLSVQHINVTVSGAVGQPNMFFL